MRYQAIGDFIIIKIKLKKTLIISVKENFKRTDSQEIESATIFSVGENVKFVKPGDEVDVVNRPYYHIEKVEEIIGAKKDENIKYVKAKEEDILGKIIK